MKSILRLIVLVALLGAIMTLGESLVLEPMIGAAFVGFSYWLFGDFLGFLQNTNFLDKVRRLLFWVCILFSLVIGFTGTFQELFYEGSYFGMDPLSKALTCGSLPATVATIWLATFTDYHDANKAVVPLLMIGGLIIGGIVGFALSIFSFVGPVVLLVLCVGVSVVALVFLFKFYKKHGWLLATIGAPINDVGTDFDHDYVPKRPRSSGRSSGSSYSSGSSSYGSTSSVYSEGDSQLDYYMDDVASDNSRSRNLPYDCSIRSDVSFSHYGDDAYFTVDFTIDTSCCSAETQHEYDMMIRDAQSFQKEVMNDLFREGKKVIARMKQKYPDFRGVNFEVKVGNINEY